MMTWRPGPRGLALALLVVAAGACVPVTVNISFPQEKLDSAAKQIEDVTAQAPASAAQTATRPAVTAPAATAPAATPPTAPPAPPASGGRTVDVTPRIDTRSPEVLKATESRRQRRPELRELKSRGCIGESNTGLLEARPGDACGPEAANLISAENVDRHVIYNAFMKENKIPASDTPRVESAFAKARQERSRANDWIQLEDGQWVRKGSP
jgi:uncharacterized protein YdbL (DUF1318 family)